jgi:hypothetical protein
MNDLPRQKLKEIIVQHGRVLCDDPKRCEAFLRDYCGQYGREIFILISALKKGVAKDILDSSKIPVELLLGRLTKRMQNDLGLTEETARYAVESWAMVLDKMPPQQIQQPIIKPPKRGFLKTAGIAAGGLILVLMTQQIFGNQQTVVESTDLEPTETSYNPNPSESNPINLDTRYAKLENLLKAQNFGEADEETREIMLAVAKREKQGSLRIEDAEKFPCKELRRIDKLWLEHSGGKFGISVQQQIYQSLGGTKKFRQMESYMDRVGWRQRGEWLRWSDYNFSQTAPSGHLPSWNVLFSDARGRWVFPFLLSRYAECNT